MSVPPSRLQVGTSVPDAYALINDNFDKIVQDIRDLGANLSTTGSVTFSALAASSVSSAVFTLTSQGAISDSANQVYTLLPVSSVSGVAPQVDIYVDNDNNAAYLWPNGASLSPGQLSIFPIVTPVVTGYTNSLAAWVITMNNRDASPHTYYVKTRCGYFPSGPTGYFR